MVAFSDGEPHQIFTRKYSSLEYCHQFSFLQMVEKDLQRERERKGKEGGREGGREGGVSPGLLVKRLEDDTLPL